MSWIWILLGIIVVLVIVIALLWWNFCRSMDGLFREVAGAWLSGNFPKRK